MSRLHSSLNSVRNNSGLSEQQWDGQHQPNPTNGNVSSDIDTMLFLKKEPEATESLMAHKNIIGFSFKDCKKCNGLMGVPVTYMSEYCTEQFKILGMTSGRKEYDIASWPTKIYENAKQHNSDGTIVAGSKVNTGAEILLNSVPKNQTYYTADNASGPLIRLYNRILIQRKPIKE